MTFCGNITFYKDDSFDTEVLNGIKQFGAIINMYGPMFATRDELTAYKEMLELVNIEVVEETEQFITYSISYKDEHISDITYLGDLN